MRFKPVFTFERRNAKLRLFRLLWQKGGAGEASGFCSRLSVGARPKLLAYERDSDGWRATVLGIELHWSHAWGGRFV